MALPKDELKLTLPDDKEDFLLDDIEVFDGGFSVAGFKRFMARYSNWTAKDVGLMKVKEMKGVADTIGGAIRDAGVPKATSAS